MRSRTRGSRLWEAWRCSGAGCGGGSAVQAGAPEARIPAGPKVLQGCTICVSCRLAGPCRESGKVGREWRDSRARRATFAEGPGSLLARVPGSHVVQAAVRGPQQRRAGVRVLPRCSAAQGEFGYSRPVTRTALTSIRHGGNCADKGTGPNAAKRAKSAVALAVRQAGGQQAGELVLAVARSPVPATGTRVVAARSVGPRRGLAPDRWRS